MNHPRHSKSTIIATLKTDAAPRVKNFVAKKQLPKRHRDVKAHNPESNEEATTHILQHNNPETVTQKSWDLAHEAVKENPDIHFAEPEVPPTKALPFWSRMMRAVETFRNNLRHQLNYDPFWPYPNDEAGKPYQDYWHLGAAFSGLEDARKSYDPNTPVLIAHLDTGYDPNHNTLPRNLWLKHQKNFASDKPESDSAVDPMDVRGINRQAGHGTGTLGLLAGKGLKDGVPQHLLGKDLGGAPDAHILPIRISPTVILLKTSAFVQAMDYILDARAKGLFEVDVISMSMGGLASAEWARVVNQAYEAGIVMVMATGDNFNSIPSTHVVFPARFKRVIGATGVTYKGEAYWREHSPFGIMMGNWGPASVMDKTLAAYTPNVPWAMANGKTNDSISFSGSGTSAATPQIAAAAALYLNKYKKDMLDYTGYQKVEAVRNALYESATAASDEKKPYRYFGNGFLNASKALQVPPVKLPITPPDDVHFPFWEMLRGELPGKGVLKMFELEIMQLWHQNKGTNEIIEEHPGLVNNTKKFDELTPHTRNNFITALINDSHASHTLKGFLKEKKEGLTK